MTPITQVLTAAFVSAGLCTSAIAAPVIHAAPKAPSSTALHLVGAGDYLCTARLFGKKARLWLKADKPVQYQWSNRAALKASMSGNVISIDATPTATLSNVEIGKDSKGNKVIQGDWKFKTNTQDDVVFTCKAN